MAIPFIALIPYDTDLARNTKGTSYIIGRDFPRETRLKRSWLVVVRKEIDQLVEGLRMPLGHVHLLVKNTRFTWEEGMLSAGPHHGALEGYSGQICPTSSLNSQKDTEQSSKLPMSTRHLRPTSR